jgi:hypothetical protein
MRMLLRNTPPRPLNARCYCCCCSLLLPLPPVKYRASSSGACLAVGSCWGWLVGWLHSHIHQNRRYTTTHLNTALSWISPSSLNVTRVTPRNETRRPDGGWSRMGPRLVPAAVLLGGRSTGWVQVLSSSSHIGVALRGGAQRAAAAPVPRPIAPPTQAPSHQLTNTLPAPSTAATSSTANLMSG